MLACVLMSASAEGVCPEGWFGENCMFQCHCSYSPACYYNGSCPQGDVCEFGYFGPACQYIDLCLLACTGDVPSFIVDNNDYTCNPDPDSDSVQMTFQGEFLFQWIRVVVDNPLTLNRLTLLLNQKHPCVNERWFRVSRVAVDVYCDNTDALSVLQVYGDAAASICSIHVSAGRNLALKQRTWQSSHDNTTLSNTSANAVDGFIDEHYPKHDTCSRTRTELNPTWRVKYARPVILSLVVIHVSLGRQMILRQFNLTTENGHNRVNSIYTHDANQTLERTFVLLKSTDFITSLIIVALGNQALELCEVETFGETVCPDKTYGISCGEACKCWGNKSCAVATGFCSSPCVPGRYGFKCSRNCSITCTDGVCRERSGHCYSCKAGYRGELCGETCPAGTFGPDCLSVCSKYCRQICHSVIGTCDCIQGHQGTRCTACADGKYGEHCDDPCPLPCQKGPCDADTGACTDVHFSVDLSISSLQRKLVWLVILPAPLMTLVICVYLSTRKSRRREGEQ